MVKKGNFESKNDTLTYPEQLQKNFEKVSKMSYLPKKIVKNHPLWWANFDKNFKFRVHIPTFWAANTAKTWHFKSNNKALTHTEHLQDNFEKVSKMIFLDPKTGQKSTSYLSQTVEILSKI